MRLSDFRVLTFDCYGTLIDWESGIVAALQPLMAKGKARLDRDAALASFGRHEAAQQHETPEMRYSDLLADVHRRLAEEWGVAATDEEHRAFGRSVPDWPAFPDSAEALASLKRHYKLVILSNVDRASFSGSNARLGVAFDAIYTAEDIGSYKPDRRNFAYMLDALGEQGIGRKRHPAYRPEPVSRPCAGEGIRSGDGLDRPPPRAGRMGRHAPRRRGALRFPLREPRRDGRGAPQRSGRARLRPCTAGRPRGGPRSNSLACGRPRSATARRARSGGCCR